MSRWSWDYFVSIVEVGHKSYDTTDILRVRLQIRPLFLPQVDTIFAIPRGQLWETGDAEHDDQSALRQSNRVASDLYFPSLCLGNKFPNPNPLCK